MLRLETVVSITVLLRSRRLLEFVMARGALLHVRSSMVNQLVIRAAITIRTDMEMELRIWNLARMEM